MTQIELTPASAAPGRTRGRWLRLVSGLGAALALIVVLFSSTSLRDASVWSALARQPLAIGAIALASAALQTWLSAVKWRMLLRRAAPELADAVTTARLFAYTAFGNLIGQVLPPYVAGPAVRGIVMKARHQADFGRNAVLAGYEQVFDMAVLLIGGIAALALLLAGIDGISGVVMVALVVAAACTVLFVLPRALRPARIAGMIPRSWAITARIRASIESGAAAGLDAPSLMGRLGLLSLLRYGVLALRTALIGLLLLPTLGWPLVTLAFATVQLSAVAVVTPGNLGVTELGWSAMAAFSPGTLAGEFVAFALALRVSGLLASALLVAGSLLALRRG